MAKKIYLDYASATPVDSKVIAKMRQYWSTNFYNPSAVYLSAKAVANDIKVARQRVAAILGARQTEVIFTAGGTEANNLAINGVMQSFPNSKILTSAIEHDSILKPAGKYNHKELAVNSDGRIKIEELKNKIDDQTVLVSIMYVNNEIGTVQPIAEISKILKEVRAERVKRGLNLPLYFHTDACQAPSYFDLHVDKMGIDIMTINGGKIYGPKQSGALYIKKGTRLLPQILGGGQEQGYRSGTENVPNIVGLTEALVIAQKYRPDEAKRVSELKNLFIKTLEEKLGDKVRINGSTKYRAPNNVNATFFGQDNERLVMELDERGVECAVGSACSASSEDPSHVLMAIGLSEDEARSTLRFSLGKNTTESDVRNTVDKLIKCL